MGPWCTVCAQQTLTQPDRALILCQKPYMDISPHGCLIGRGGFLPEPPPPTHDSPYQVVSGSAPGPLWLNPCTFPLPSCSFKGVDTRQQRCHQR